METIENTTTKILKYTLWGCLYLTLFTVLLVHSKFLFPFITPKTLYFRILVEVAAFLYLLLALAHPFYRPKMSLPLWFILGFGLIVLFTSLIGLDPYRSFWGNIERGEGFLFISHLIVFCFILSQVFKTKDQWLNFFSFSVFVSLAVGLYALAQQAGVKWAIVNSAGDRFSSTLGNASYLGAYALGHFWLSFLLFWQRRHIFWKIIFAILALFNIYLLFKTQTRGAMLAFFISLFLFILSLVFLAQRKKIRKIFIGLFIVFILLAGFVFINKDKLWLQNFAPLRRLMNISLTDVTAESRLYALDSSWQGWQDRFLLGYGWENYNLAFNKYFHPEIYRDAGSQIWFDRAHNTIFDIAIASGLIGLLCYLCIYSACFISLIKIIKKQRHQLYLAMPLMGFLLAHFMQNIFVFDSLPTYIMLFSVFAMSAFLAAQEKIQKIEEPAHAKPLNLYALIFGLPILALLIFNLNIRPAQANIKGIHALIQVYSGNLQAGLTSFKQALDMNTYQSREIREKLAEAILSSNKPQYVQDSKTIQDNFNYAIEQMKENIQAAPLDTRNYLYLMTLYNSAATSFPNSDFYQQVISLGNHALKLSPTRPQIYYEMGRAAIGLGQASQGIQYFQKAVDLNPKTLDSYWHLLTAYAVTGQYASADNVYKQMINLGLVENIRNLERLAQIYSSVKNYSALILINQKLIKLEPENINYWTNLAATYKEMGDANNARRIAQEMLTKFPENQASTQQFLESID